MTGGRRCATATPQPLDARVPRPLARMTLDEKLAQLGLVWSFEWSERGRRRPGAGPWAPRRGHRPGQRVAGATNLGRSPRPRSGTRSSGSSSRGRGSGIPAILHEETPPRSDGPRRHVLPAVHRRGGSWDLHSSRRSRPSIRRRLPGDRRDRALAPVLDIARDPRWGRVEETYGEDPYLAAALGCAYVRGIQGADLATASPHRQAHGRPRPGRRRAQPGSGAHRAARASGGIAASRSRWPSATPGSPA